MRRSVPEECVAVYRKNLSAHTKRTFRQDPEERLATYQNNGDIKASFIEHISFNQGLEVEQY
jgi:hypothetical protein